MLGFQPTAHIHNHVSDHVEVGYGRYGPSLAISGTLTALRKMVFVEEMTLELSRVDQGEKETRLFRWFAFRPHEFSYRPLQEIDFKMPAKFMVPTTHAHPYNIIFNDPDRISELKPAFEKIKLSWHRFRDKNIFSAPQKDDFALFQDFAQDAQFLELMNRLFELCYWQKGKYGLTIKVHMEKPKDIHEIRKDFFLAPEDVGTFKLNVFSIMSDLCHQPTDKCQLSQVKLF